MVLHPTKPPDSATPPPFPLRELLVLVHPDKYKGDKSLAAEAFRVLNGAYEVLGPLVQ